MHCYEGLFFFISSSTTGPTRIETGLDWAGTGWRNTAFRYDDLIWPRGTTGAFPPLFFSITWSEAEDWLVRRAVGSTADEADG